MADDVSLSFYQVLVTNIVGIPCLYVPKTVLKVNLWINTYIFQATRPQVSEFSSYLSLKWLIPSNGGSVPAMADLF